MSSEDQELPQNIANELQLLEALTATPETTQADLAARVGVAVGTVNWYLKRWSKKGYVKVRRISRWNWSYLLTPAGIARKHQLASEYVEASFSLYRRIRQQAQQLLREITQSGNRQIVIRGEGEIAEICRLTCLEQGVKVVEETTVEDSAQSKSDSMPVLAVDGLLLTVQWPGEAAERD